VTRQEKRLAVSVAKKLEQLAWSIEDYVSAGGEWIVPKRTVTIAKTAAIKLMRTTWKTP
jgi:hypothetical protein